MLNRIKTITVEKIKEAFVILRQRGFFSIFGGTLIVKCVSFCSILFLPRIIADTDQYGILSIVDNFNSYLVLISGMGLSNSILRFCALREGEGEKKAIFQYCLKWGLVINGIIIVAVVTALSFMDLSIEGLERYLFIGVGLPIMSYVFDCLTLFLRADMRNKEYARLSIAYACLYAGLQIMLAIWFKITGALVGRYIAIAISLMIGIIIIKNKTELFGEELCRMNRNEKKELWAFAIVGLCSNAFSIIMPMNEQMVLTAILADESQVAYYKVATIGPTNLQFLANGIVMFVYPYFAKKSFDFEWIKKKTFLTIGAIAAIIIPISLFMFIFTPFLIRLIFGNEYLPAIGLMKVMCVTFSINSIIRMPMGNILGAIGKIKFNAVNAGATAILHICLDYFFISRYGINGAAWALTIAYIISGVADIVYIVFLSRNAKKEKGTV